MMWQHPAPKRAKGTSWVWLCISWWSAYRRERFHSGPGNTVSYWRPLSWSIWIRISLITVHFTNEFLIKFFFSCFKAYKICSCAFGIQWWIFGEERILRVWKLIFLCRPVVRFDPRFPRSTCLHAAQTFSALQLKSLLFPDESQN